MGVFDDFKRGIGEITSGRATEKFQSGQKKVRSAIGAPEDPNTKPRANLGNVGSVAVSKLKGARGNAGGTTSTTTAPDFASQLGEFSDYLPEGFDIEAAMNWRSKLEGDENFKSTVEALGITPNFIKPQQQAAPGLEIQSLLSEFIQPQLQRQQEQRMGIADQYQQAMSSIMQGANLGPYADILKRQVPTEVAQMKQQAQAGEQIGGIQVLLNLLSQQAGQKQEQAYQRGLASGGGVTGGGFAEGLA